MLTCNATAGSMPGNIAENDRLGLTEPSERQREKVHPAAPQPAAQPLGSRQNQAQPNTGANPASPTGPQVVIDFETGIAPASPTTRRSPQRRRGNNLPQQFKSDDKENQ